MDWGREAPTGNILMCGEECGRAPGKVDGEVRNVATVTGSMMLQFNLLLPRRVQPGLAFWVPEVRGYLEN